MSGVSKGTSPQGGVRIKPIPERRCAACGARDAKGTLIRIVRSPQGAVSIDIKGKAIGRGSYLCRTESCITKGIQRGGIERTLKVNLTGEHKARLLKDTLMAGVALPSPSHQGMSATSSRAPSDVSNLTNTYT